MLREEKPAVVMIHNFTGQNTASIYVLMEANYIHADLLPPNTTDQLQPLDVSLNKPDKDLVRHKFQEWYTNEIIKQLDGNDMETSMLEPIV